MNEQLVQQVVAQVLNALSQQSSDASTQLAPQSLDIPIGVSARHVHLSQPHVEQLFGKGYQLTGKSPLSQPGQFAANEQVTIVGPKGSLHGVRILGPARDLSQVEVSATDSRTLGINAPLRISGEIANSAPVTLIGPKGSLYLHEGCIVAVNHIHMSPADAHRFSVEDGQRVHIEVQTERPMIFSNVLVRVNPRFALEMHVDTDEGNAAFITKGSVGRILDMQTSKQKQERNTLQPVEVHSQQKYSKKLVSEKDVLQCQCKELIVSKKTIITALAFDKARQMGIQIIRQ